MSVSGQRSDTDKAITQKLLSHVHSLPVYGQEEAWEQIEARVFQKKPTRYRPSPQMLVASAVVIAILVVFAYSPTGNAWVTRHLGVYISTVSESVRNLVLHEVPSSAHQRMVVPLLSKIDFQPLIISPGTNSWSLQDATLQEQGGGDHILVLTYVDAQNCTYTLSQSGLDSNRSTGCYSWSNSSYSAFQRW